MANSVGSSGAARQRRLGKLLSGLATPSDARAGSSPLARVE